MSHSWLFRPFVSPQAYDQHTTRAPLNLDRDCPSYLVFAPCAEHAEAVADVHKLGDPFRLLEGYRACKSRANDSNTGENSSTWLSSPRGGEGFVADETLGDFSSDQYDGFREK